MGHETLKEKAQKKLDDGNASQLGDPVSMKAETSSYVPEGEEGAAKSGKDTNASQDDNAAMLGDQVSLKAESSDSEPTEQDRGALKDKRQSKI